MKQTIIAVLFAAMTFGAALPAQAITFDFFWSSDPVLDTNLTFSSNPNITVTGTMDINVAPGARFSLSDIANVNLTVAGPNILDFAITGWIEAGGNVSSDGLSASFVDAGSDEPYAITSSGSSFGCRADRCEGGSRTEISVFDSSNGVIWIFDYTSETTALASMQLTAVQPPAAVPLPAALPFLLASLGALGLMRGARRQP